MGTSSSARFFGEVGVAAALVAGGVISWLVTRWRVEDGTLRIETGLIRRSSQRFPLVQIQAIDTIRPLLARVFGLAELRLRIAGHAGRSGRLAYLSEREADLLRARLLALAHGIAENTPEPPQRVLLSVPTGFGMFTFEVRMDDVRAVMEEVSSEQAVVFGHGDDGASLAAVFGATHPEKTRGLILYGGRAKGLSTADYPWGYEPSGPDVWAHEVEAYWGSDAIARLWLRNMAPSVGHDEQAVRWFARMLRQSATPGTDFATGTYIASLDLRGMLSAIHVPTLVLHRTGDSDVPIGGGRDLKERIDGSRLAGCSSRLRRALTTSHPPTTLVGRRRTSAAIGGRTLSSTCWSNANRSIPIGCTREDGRADEGDGLENR